MQAPRAGGRSAGDAPVRPDIVVKYFKERVYATFTGLAIVLVVAAADEPDAAHMLTALALGVLGIVAAGFVSDAIAHLAVHRVPPSRREWFLLVRIAARGLSTAVVPVLVLAGALVGLYPEGAAVVVVCGIYVVTLAVTGWLAVRRSRLSWRAQLLVLAVLLAFGLAVIGIQALAHAL